MAKSNKEDNSIISGVIDQLSQIADTGRDVAADFIETVSPETAEFIRPSSKAKSKSSSVIRDIPISSASVRKTTSRKSSAKKAVGRKASVSSKRISAAKSKVGSKSSRRTTQHAATSK